ncbi:MAG: hypothetical protein O3B64_01420 [bacterium]|nr:hypothetical protein [bacterium]
MAQAALATVRIVFSALLMCMLFVSSLFLFSSQNSARAASAPNVVNYQGRILNSSGVPVADASVDMIFELYDASSGGSCVWSNSSASCATATAISVTLTDGLFAENLGETGDGYAAIGDSIFGDNADLYLQVTVEGEALTPRKRMAAAPYALNADTLDGISSEDFDFDQIFSATDKILNVTGSDLVFSLDDGSDFVIDLQSTGDFNVKEGGALFFAVNEDTTIDYSPDTAGAAFTINSLSSGPSLLIDQEQNTGVSVGATTGGALHINNTDNQHYGLTVYSNASTTAAPLTNFYLDNASATQSVLNVRSDATAADPAIFVDVNGDSSGLYIDSLSTTAAVQFLQNTAARAAGDLFDINDTGTYTSTTGLSGSGFDIDQNLTVNDGATTLTVSGHMIDVSTNGIETSGTINWTGSLGYFDQNFTDATGDIIFIQNAGTGNALEIDQDGDATALNVASAGTTGFIAEFFSDGGADTNEGISIQACLDTNPTTGCNLLEFRDGNGTVIGAIEGDGAGGVTAASGGSDYAELFPGTYTDFSEGDILGLGNDGNIKLAETAEEMIGALSIAPNTLGNWRPDWKEDGGWVPVALLGQVPAHVTAAEGSITAGDYLTLSAEAGRLQKLTGPGEAIGRALEAHASGDGTILIYIDPGFHAGTMIASDSGEGKFAGNFTFVPMGEASPSDSNFDSYALSLRGAAWDGTSVHRGFDISTSITDSANYELSVSSTSFDDAFALSESGDVYLGGRLYPSDTGTRQNEKYIFYDGSEGVGGDFMRTNASGWGSGSYDFAEMFPAEDTLAAGDVVVFGSRPESVRKSTGADREVIAGIVSTQPGFLAGDNIAGHMPIALAGRVPVKVSEENGPIAIGDPLAASKIHPGYAAKAIEGGMIAGYALEASSSTLDAIIAFVDRDNISAPTSLASATSIVEGATNVSHLAFLWSLDDDGTVRTRNRFVREVQGASGALIALETVVAAEEQLQLSGSSTLEGGEYFVALLSDWPEFADVLAGGYEYRVIATPQDVSARIYVANKTVDGFTLKTDDIASVQVDWLLIAVPASETMLESAPADPSEVESPEVPVTEEIADGRDTPFSAEEIADAPADEAGDASEEDAGPEDSTIE